jgi:hypothetical protein
MKARHALTALLALTTVTAVACDDDDEDPGGPPDTETFEADLTGDAERPDPVVTTATGDAEFTASTSGGVTTVVYTVTVSGDLSGPVTAAHIHGPAGANDVADPIVTLTVSNTTGTNGILVSGSFTATATVLQHMQAGNTYVNLHTTANPGGEIRGQISD